MQIAVVGAGVAGAFCSKALKKMGAVVTVFEAGRGPGGRMSRRKEGQHQFDHGAQFFYAESDAFVRLACDQIKSICSAFATKYSILSIAARLKR